VARRTDDAEHSPAADPEFDASAAAQDADAAEPDDVIEDAEDAEDLDELAPTAVQSEEAAALWSELDLAPVEIALPAGVGLTLRHYRTVLADVEDSDDVADSDDVESDAGLDADEEVDDNDLDDADADLDTDSDLEDDQAPDSDDDAAHDEAAHDDAAHDERAGGEELEEAVFLSSDGRLHLFRSAEGLVDFIQSGAPHDLVDIPTWSRAAKAIKPDVVVPAGEDRYELDLVVENLRGGRDVWEADLLIGAGEVARDLGYAIGLDGVLRALAPGSPLDDLDDALRATGFFARRRLRRVGSEQAALAWRSIIGKISAAVEWHD
jgi:hypothetical protein